MKGRVLMGGVLLIALALAWLSAHSQQQRSGQMGGRPGEFHFILKEQADYNRVQFRQMRTTLERMRADVAASAADEATRTRMLQDMQSMELFVSSMEAQLTTPVGQTAGDVENRLNHIKGQMACGVCHAGSTAMMRRSHGVEWARNSGY